MNPNPAQSSAHAEPQHGPGYLAARAVRLAWKHSPADRLDAERMRNCAALRGKIPEHVRQQYMAGIHLTTRTERRGAGK